MLIMAGQVIPIQCNTRDVNKHLIFSNFQHSDNSFGGEWLNQIQTKLTKHFLGSGTLVDEDIHGFAGVVRVFKVTRSFSLQLKNYG